MDISLVSETYPGDINGVATTLGALVGGLESRGHNVDVICPKSPQRQPLRSGQLVSSARLPFYPQVRMGFFSTRSFIERWEENPPDVVHIATEGPLGFTALKAAVRMGFPVSTSFHTNFHQYANAYRLGWLTRPAVRYLRWFHNQADITFIPTESQSKNLSAAGFNRLVVLGRGVDTQLFHPDRRDERLRLHWGAHADTPVLIYVGRLAAEKNLELLIAAVKKALWVNPSTVVVVVGDGPERAWLEKRLPDVIFTGALSGLALARCYASADGFIQPSSTETFGIVLLEAMA
ncbi:MAG TPA: glycosyltransferase family 1 protein, partial [Halothiobacillaceae bacterium]|nr:glycosyltransferase family 1 protein [Halothiobacillaceae bacterium]